MRRLLTQKEVQSELDKQAQEVIESIKKSSECELFTYEREEYRKQHLQLWGFL
jgi:hypothetical protein